MSKELQWKLVLEPGQTQYLPPDLPVSFEVMANLGEQPDALPPENVVTASDKEPDKPDEEEETPGGPPVIVPIMPFGAPVAIYSNDLTVIDSTDLHDLLKEKTGSVSPETGTVGGFVLQVEVNTSDQENLADLVGHVRESGISDLGFNAVAFRFSGQAYGERRIQEE
jgi:hypothetical protein